MTRVYVQGIGCVSPAGRGVAPLWSVVHGRSAIPVGNLARPGWPTALRVRSTPTPDTKPACLSHPRFRRTSAIAQHTTLAALEALGADRPLDSQAGLSLGVIVCLLAGCVSYSRRFYEEALEDPSKASPLLFPETVFNAPASHLAAFLGVTGPVYTLVGDDGAFLQGTALAANWIARGQVEGCLVLGAEEQDWIVADALRLFERRTIHSDGAGALYLGCKRSGSLAELACVTNSFSFTANRSKNVAALQMRRQLPPFNQDELVCLGTQGIACVDEAENAAWSDWTGARLAPKEVVGEAFSASTGWQCVVACEAIQRLQVPAANVSVVGTNQQAIGARFVKV